jgi:hypothetical protein
MSALLRLPALAWLWPARRWVARFVRLHLKYEARRLLGGVTGGPRVVERGGRVGTTWWLVSWYPQQAGLMPLPVRNRHRYRVRWMDERCPGPPSERWVWSWEDALAWVALAATEPAWALMHADGEDPWPLLRCVDGDEVRGVLEAMGVEAETVERMMVRHAAQRRCG